MFKNLLKHAFARGNYKGVDTKWTQELGSFYDLSATDIDGNNVAFADKYAAMQKMTAALGARGLNVMAFPCNQFGAQEPHSEAEIKAFATSKFGVTFPMFSKIEVNGDGTHPVYKFLKTCFPGDITWNFASKFLVNQAGVPVARFEKESWEEIEATVTSLLAEGNAAAGSAAEEKTSE